MTDTGIDLSSRAEHRYIIRVSLSEKQKRELLLACMFGAFAFLQFTVLGLANHAGEGCLTAGQRDLVYYALQVFVILGYLLHGLFFFLCTGERRHSAAVNLILGVFPACMILLAAAGRASFFYVIVSMAAALCLGVIGGAAHLRMSLAAGTGTNVAGCMGFGSAAAVVLQYLLQIRSGVTPLLPVFMLAAFLLFLSVLWRQFPETAVEDARKQENTARGQVVFTVLIASIFILFTCFYNETIHHLQIRSEYVSFNVYSWPRLTMVPGYLLFALIGDRKNGRYVPITALCIMLIALLNVVLTGSPGSYWLNMCLFYCAIAAFTSYYLLTFWRLAPGTGHPAVWAPFGRILDSCMVLLSGAVHLGSLPSTVVLGADIAGVALIILIMAVNGDFNLNETGESESSEAVQPVGIPAMSETENVMPGASLIPMRSQEETLEQIQIRYSLTPRELEVLRELVLTEDKQKTISERLNIQPRTLQNHVTRIYRKMGASTRSGLSDLYHKCRAETFGAENNNK